MHANEIDKGGRGDRQQGMPYPAVSLQHRLRSVVALRRGESVSHLAFVCGGRTCGARRASNECGPEADVVKI